MDRFQHLWRSAAGRHILNENGIRGIRNLWGILGWINNLSVSFVLVIQFNFQCLKILHGDMAYWQTLWIKVHKIILWETVERASELITALLKKFSAFKLDYAHIWPLWFQTYFQNILKNVAFHICGNIHLLTKLTSRGVKCILSFNLFQCSNTSLTV